MIHHVRKMENRLDTVVYGCVSDGFIFTFLRIDNSDKVRFFLTSHVDFIILCKAYLFIESSIQSSKCQCGLKVSRPSGYILTYATSSDMRLQQRLLGIKERSKI